MSSISKAMSRTRPDLTSAKNFSVPSDKDPFVRAEQREKVRKPTPSLRRKVPEWYTPKNVATSTVKPKSGLRFQMNQRTGLMLSVMVIALLSGTVGGVVMRQGQVNARMQALQAAPPAMVELDTSVNEFSAVPRHDTAEVIAEFHTSAEQPAVHAETSGIELAAAAAMVHQPMADSQQVSPEATDPQASVLTATMTAPSAMVAAAEEPDRVVAMLTPQQAERVTLQPKVSEIPDRVVPVQAIYEAPVELPQVPMGVMHEVLYEGDAVPEVSTEPVRLPSANSATTREKAKPQPAVEVRLEGIFWDRTRPMAIVNGDIVEVGDRVPGGGEISEIQRSAVIIKQGEKLITLRP